MGLNKQTGQMYPWVSATWNPIRGRCPHDCVYCSIKGIARRFNQPQGELRLVGEELPTSLGENNTIFVGSSTDMWASDVPREWIERVLAHCRKHYKNKYLFQTKNPAGFWGHEFPENTTLGITLETNRDTFPPAPSPAERARTFSVLDGDFKKMISIEPVMDFDVDPFVDMLRSIKPEFVSIGADSKRHGLPEPTSGKIACFILLLKTFTEVRCKPNLKRLGVGELYDHR